MERKGIGKLVPFAICKRIEVLSAGGAETDLGYRVFHFVMDYEKIGKQIGRFAAAAQRFAATLR